MSILDKSNFAHADLTKVNFGMLPDLLGHSDYVRSVAFSPDGKTVVSGSEDENM
jgi:WD40 repeat protein